MRFLEDFFQIFLVPRTFQLEKSVREQIVRTEIRNVIIEESRKMCDDFFPSLRTILKFERYQMILIKVLSNSMRTKFSFRKESANPWDQRYLVDKDNIYIFTIYY